MAHSGGHYHKEDGKLLNTWRLKSGVVAKGNFSFAKDNKIFLEQEDGIMQAIVMDDLITQDQQLAKFKIKKYTELNYLKITDIKIENYNYESKMFNFNLYESAF